MPCRLRLQTHEPERAEAVVDASRLLDTEPLAREEDRGLLRADLPVGLRPVWLGVAFLNLPLDDLVAGLLVVVTAEAQHDVAGVELVKLLAPVGPAGRVDREAVGGKPIGWARGVGREAVELAEGTCGVASDGGDVQVWPLGVAIVSTQRDQLPFLDVVAFVHPDARRQMDVD